METGMVAALPSIDWGINVRIASLILHRTR